MFLVVDALSYFIIQFNKNITVRPVALALEKVLYQPFRVLDKGFIRIVDYMGNDSSIVQAARVSWVPWMLRAILES